VEPFLSVWPAYAPIKDCPDEADAPMKLIIERSTLLRSLGHIASVVERRNTIPILSNVLLRGIGSQVFLTATDMDLEVRACVEGLCDPNGAATVPAHTLHDIIRKLPDGSQVQMETGDSGSTLVVRCERSVFRLGALPETDFPRLASGDLPVAFDISAGDLKALIERTRFAISTE
jgi:DNA polymerase III subunit beta